MDWHRLFGLILTDYLSGTPYVVELEKDLSRMQQYLDVVIVRKTAGAMPFRLPDGLDNLVDHNLISFKSHHEAFDVWAMKELMAHSVNYRKQASPALSDLIPDEQIRCYGVCARFPTQLQDSLTEQRRGVWECRWGSDVVRVLVLRDLPREEHNAPLHLFSAAREQVQYGQEHFRQRSPDTSSLVRSLLGRYQQEGLPMPYTMEDFRREFKQEALKLLTPEERLEGLTPEKRLEGLSPEEIENYLKRLKDGSPTKS